MADLLSTEIPPLKDCFPFSEEHERKGFLYHLSCGEELRFREKERRGDCVHLPEDMCLLVTRPPVRHTVASMWFHEFTREKPSEQSLAHGEPHVSHDS